METLNQNSAAIYQLPTQKQFAYQIKHLPAKRSFDIFFSLIILALLSPLYILIFLSVRLTSKGKAIYSHERIGRGGRPFKCYKFRTMHFDAEKRLQNLLRENSELKREWQRTFKLKNDPRITFVGRFLRKTSLDELPQFWNVLKGDLSVVGPRPVIREEVNRHFGVKAYKILSVRPGVTGLWQVSGRSNTSYKTRIQLDEKYIDNRSALLDFKLVIKTVPCIFNSKGAY